MSMKIAQLMTGSSIDFEARKREAQRREMGEAYKKTSQYQSPKNPMLAALEDLLSGKTEKDLHAADQVARREEYVGTSDDATAEQESVSNSTENITDEQKLEQPEIKYEIRQLEMTQQEVIKHEQAHKSVGGDVTGPVSYTYTTGPDDKRYINGGEVSIQLAEGSTPEETINILEKVRAAALAPADPSPQDLRVAASAASQIQQVRGQLSDSNVDKLSEEKETNQEPFAGVDTNAEIPSRFLADFSERDAEQATLFGREIENLLYQRTFNKASSKYKEHIAMVNNGYRSFDEPNFSKTA